jgi:hypothetical protein
VQAALRHGHGALIVVADPVNLMDAQAMPHKGKAKRRFETLFGNANVWP